MGLLSFDDSGGAIAVTLNDIAEMALAHGFEKKGPQTPGKKAAQRADLQAFFQTYGVKAFTPFKEKFESEKLLPPDEHLEKVKKVSGQLWKNIEKPSPFSPIQNQNISCFSLMGLLPFPRPTLT